MKCLPILILFASCADPEPIIPVCSNVDVSHYDGFVHFVIHSEAESVDLIRESGFVTTVQRPFFGCVTLRDDLGLIWKVEDGCKCLTSRPGRDGDK